MLEELIQERRKEWLCNQCLVDTGILQQSHDGIDFTSFNYKFVEGTSPSCALVSGVAALIIGKATISLTPLQIRGIIEGSALDLGTVGWDEYYGWGKVNAYYALLDTP